MSEPVDDYTPAWPRPLNSHPRTHARDGASECDQIRADAPAARLLYRLDRYVSAEEKKWARISAAFDDVLGVARESCDSAPGTHRRAARPSMPIDVSPFSLSDMFCEIQSAENSMTSAQDTSADLSLYGWLSAQGAQTILPVPVAARPVDNEVARTDKGEIVFPLSPPPSARIPPAAKLDGPPLARSFSDVRPFISLDEYGASHASAFDKPLPALPISPPRSPVALTTKRFCDVYSPHENPSQTKSPNVLYVDLEETDEHGCDDDNFNNALARNLALQHASAAAVRQYRLVVQELKWAVISRSMSSPHSVDLQHVAFRPLNVRDTPLNDAAGDQQQDKSPEPVDRDDADKCHDVAPSQDGNAHARQFAVLLTRKAMDEEIDAASLMDLAARLEKIARQRKVLATNVMRSSH